MKVIKLNEKLQKQKNDLKYIAKQNQEEKIDEAHQTIKQQKVIAKP